jgi:hypothetical protein
MATAGSSRWHLKGGEAAVDCGKSLAMARKTAAAASALSGSATRTVPGHGASHVGVDAGSSGQGQLARGFSAAAWKHGCGQERVLPGAVAPSDGAVAHG